MMHRGAYSDVDLWPLQREPSSHLPKSWPHKQLKRDHCRDRVSWETEETGLADTSDRKGLAWFHFDTPEVQSAQLFKCGSHKVPLANRYSPGRHDDIRGSRTVQPRTCTQDGLRGGGLIWNMV